MTLTVRSATVSGATTKGSALTFAEMDANWAHVIQASNQTFVPAGSGAVSRSAQDKLREFVSVRDQGAVGDGSTDDLAAFNRAIALVTPGGRIAVPYSASYYYLSDDLNISKPIHLVGDGGMDQVNATQLKFANGKGIRIYYSADSPVGTDGSWTVIENMRITPIAKTTPISGVRISAVGVRLVNVGVAGFGSHGIHIAGDSNGGSGIANLWRLDHVYTNLNDGSGLFVDGANANAGLGTLITSFTNGACGIFDSSLLGNTYVGCNTAGNTTAAYKTDDASAKNLLIGCYSETGEGASALVFPTMVVGGTHGAGFTGGSTHSNITATVKGISVGSATGTISMTTPLMNLANVATPQLLFSPSSGSTKNAQFQQSGDVLNFNDSGVATRVRFDIATGTLAVGGASMSTTTRLVTPAGTTAASSLRIPHGAAPTSPVDGDMWTTTAGLFVRINGSTVGPLS